MSIYEDIYNKYGLSPTQKEIIKMVGKDKTVLEIGASTGYMTASFLENGCIVDVVENNSKSVSKLPKKIRKVYNQSIEDEAIYKNLEGYDFIVLADVLEHLIKPETVLRNLSKISRENTKLIVSLPNIASWVMRKQLFLNGDFEYKESGLLDKTHLHFYTVNTLPKLLSENGWKLQKMVGTIIRLPLEGLISSIPVLGWLFKNFFYQKLSDNYKNLAYYHFLVEASKK